MVKYIIIHNKHEGCYDFQCYEDEATRMRLTSITINPPKIFMFDNKEKMREISLRMVTKLADLKKSFGDEKWKRTAEVTCMRRA